MKKALKEAWIKDLKRNPKAKGTSSLCYIDLVDGKTKWCCLGRLADIGLSFDWVQVPPIPGHNRIEWATDATERDLLFSTGSSTQLLSRKQLKKLGLDSFDQCELAELNDSSHDWDEVISYIEDNIDGD